MLSWLEIVSIPLETRNAIARNVKCSTEVLRAAATISIDPEPYKSNRPSEAADLSSFWIEMVPKRERF